MARVLADGTGAEWSQVWVVVGDRPVAGRHLAAGSGAVEDADPQDESDPAGARSPCGTAGTCSASWSSRSGPGCRSPPSSERLFAGLAEPGRAGPARHPAARRARAAADRAVRCARTSCGSRGNAWSTPRTTRRRLLERDIHDGAQQHLVALAVNLRLADTLAARSPERAVALLAAQEAAADEAVATLVQLVPRHLPAAARGRGRRRRAAGRGRRTPSTGRRDHRARPRAGTRWASRRRRTSPAWRRCRTPPSTPARRRPGRAARRAGRADPHRDRRRRRVRPGTTPAGRRPGQHARPGRVRRRRPRRPDSTPGGGTRIHACSPRNRCRRPTGAPEMRARLAWFAGRHHRSCWSSRDASSRRSTVPSWSEASVARARLPVRQPRRPRLGRDGRADHLPLRTAPDRLAAQRRRDDQLTLAAAPRRTASGCIEARRPRPGRLGRRRRLDLVADRRTARHRRAGRSCSCWHPTATSCRGAGGTSRWVAVLGVLLQPGRRADHGPRRRSRPRHSRSTSARSVRLVLSRRVPRDQRRPDRLVRLDAASAAAEPRRAAPAAPPDRGRRPRSIALGRDQPVRRAALQRRPADLARRRCRSSSPTSCCRSCSRSPCCATGSTTWT